MTKLSFKVIGKNKSLLLFPVISGVSMMLILSMIFVGFWFFPDLLEAPQWMFFIMGFLVYVILFYISYFFQAALVACAYATMEGESPGLGYGIKMASAVAGKIFMWALISAIVGMILQAIESRFPIASRLIGAVWSVATYFVVPIIVFENESAWPSVKRSWQVLKSSWGETLVASLAVGLIFVLITIPIIFIFLFAIFSAPVLWLSILFALLFLVTIVFIGVLGSAVSGVLRAALYRYVKTGKMDITLPAWFPPPQGPGHATPYEGYPQEPQLNQY